MEVHLSMALSVTVIVLNPDNMLVEKLSINEQTLRPEATRYAKEKLFNK